MSSLSRTLRLLTCFAGALLASGAVAASASAPAGGMRFSVRPDPQGSLSPGDDYFVLKARPGDAVNDALEVSNPTSAPVEVRIAAVDATTAQLGGVDYTPSDAPVRAAGSWIDLASARLTLQPGEAELVPFTVTVPDDAPPGVNLGGIAAWTPTSEGKDDGSGGLGTTVQVQTRRVVAVQVELPGPRAPELHVDGVTTTARPDGIYLQVDIRNEGHGFAEGEGALELTGESFSSVFPLDKVVPRTGVGYAVKWRDLAPADGAYPVSVEIDYGAGVARYEGEVVVGEDVRRELADRGIGAPSKEQTVPALGMAAAIAATAAAGAATWRRRTRRRGRGAPPPPPPVDRAAREAWSGPPPAPRSADRTGSAPDGGTPRTRRRVSPPPPPPPLPVRR